MTAYENNNQGMIPVDWPLFIGFSKIWKSYFLNIQNIDKLKNSKTVCGH